MARKDNSILGVDLNDREIHIVHVRFKGGKPFVNKAASVPMPDGAFTRGQVQHAGSVALAVRRLIDGMQVGGANQVVFGLNSDRVAMRNISVPPVPDADLASVVAVEVDHYSIVQTKGGAHAFLRLTPPTRQPETDQIHLAVMGVEEEITAGLRDVAERSGLEIVSLEPTQLAMLRTAALGFGSEPTAFVLMVGGLSTDAAFFVNGHIIAYRRLDVGSRTLLQIVRSSLSTGNASSIFDQPLPGAPDTGNEDYDSINAESVDRLALEARRTMDYLQREFPDFAVVDRVHIALDAPELGGIGKMLTDRLGIPTEVVRPPVAANDSPEAAMALAGSTGLGYVAAYGLAMVDAPIASARLPRVDLFSTQRSAAKREETKRNFLGSIVVSGFGIAVGLIGWVLYNGQISKVEGETQATLAQSTVIRGQTDLTVAERLKRAQQFKALRKEGVPIGVIMDYVVGSIEPGLGLKSVAITPDLKVTLTGEALEETAMIKTTQNLQRSPVLKNLMVNTFTRGDKATGNAIVFTLTASTVSADRIKLPGTPKVTR